MKVTSNVRAGLALTLVKLGGGRCGGVVVLV